MNMRLAKDSRGYFWRTTQSNPPQQSIHEEPVSPTTQDILTNLDEYELARDMGELGNYFQDYASWKNSIQSRNVVGFNSSSGQLTGHGQDREGNLTNPLSGPPQHIGLPFSSFSNPNPNYPNPNYHPGHDIPNRPDRERNLTNPSSAPPQQIGLPTSSFSNPDPNIPSSFSNPTVDCWNNNSDGIFGRTHQPPYGRDFDTHVATGRFSNGRLVVDYLGKLSWLIAIYTMWIHRLTNRRSWEVNTYILHGTPFICINRYINCLSWDLTSSLMGLPLPPGGSTICGRRPYVVCGRRPPGGSTICGMWLTTSRRLDHMWSTSFIIFKFHIYF